MAEPAIRNEEIAEVLERVADLLEVQDASPYRVRAYRAAAHSVRSHDAPLAGILASGGTEALEALPTIGRTIAANVAELVQRRGLTLLDRLEGEVSPERLLTTVPGVGPELAARLHQELSIDSLEELEVAAHDGRLGTVPGFGPRRVRAMQAQLAAILGRSARHRSRRSAWLAAPHGAREASAPLERPEVATLLDVDTEYRTRAAKGGLRRIAPRRFNPEHEAWLPVLHAERGDWHLTALFSNTARAHELGHTRDWVVIFYARDGDEGQCTVVDETHGSLRGRRVVRGRETECRAFYAASTASPEAKASSLPAPPAD